MGSSPPGRVPWVQLGAPHHCQSESTPPYRISTPLHWVWLLQDWRNRSSADFATSNRIANQPIDLASNLPDCVPPFNCSK